MLDTHFAYWVTMRDGSLTKREKAILSADDVDISASAISLWELRIKWNLFHVSGDRKGPADPAQVLAALDRLGMPVVDLSASQAATSLATPLDHRDPFDELLLIQAQETDARLLTRDRRLASHPLALFA